MTSNPSEPRSSSRGGFILATSLLVLTLLTVMLTAAFILVSAEFRTTDNAASSSRALALAEAGLESYLASPLTITASSTSDSARITFSAGYADVVGTRVRAPNGSLPGVWIMRSTGFPNDPQLSGTPASRRTIARVSQFFPGTLPIRAAMVAINGAFMSGPATAGYVNPISGDNIGGSQGTCVDPGGVAADSVGLATAGYSWTPPPATGAPWPGGEGTNGMETFGSWSQLYDSTHIDWPAITDTSSLSFTPDWMQVGSGTISQPYAGSAYPVGLVRGDATIPASNQSPWESAAGIRGVLVVTGNLTMTDRAHWDGIILVGGQLIANNQFVIHGAIITGLNRAAVPPVAVPANNVIRTNAVSTHTVRWYYCYTKLGADALSGMVPMRRVWTDGWALY